MVSPNENLSLYDLIPTLIDYSIANFNSFYFLGMTITGSSYYVEPAVLIMTTVLMFTLTLVRPVIKVLVMTLKASMEYTMR